MQNMSRVGDWGQCCKSTGQEQTNKLYRQLGQLPLFIMAACGAELGCGSRGSGSAPGNTTPGF